MTRPLYPHTRVATRRPARCQSIQVSGHAAPVRARGAALITGLLILTVMTILGLASMRGTILQERMAGNLKEQASAFQAADAAVQAALTTIELSPSPPGLDAWGPGSLTEGCKVVDADGASACVRMEALLTDWRSSTEPAQGVALSNLGGGSFSDGIQPRVTVEVRYAALEFESAAQGRGIHYYTVTALGVGQAGQSRAILQSTIRKAFAW